MRAGGTQSGSRGDEGCGDEGRGDEDRGDEDREDKSFLFIRLEAHEHDPFHCFICVCDLAADVHGRVLARRFS